MGIKFMKLTRFEKLAMDKSSKEPIYDEQWTQRLASKNVGQCVRPFVSSSHFSQAEPRLRSVSADDPTTSWT